MSFFIRPLLPGPLVALLCSVGIASCGKADDPLAVAPALPPIVLTGTDGVDELSGGPGADHFTGGPGADAMDGKGGLDYARYDTAKAGVTANLTEPRRNSGDADGDTYVSIEGLVGSPFDDHLRGDAAVNDIVGQDGNDVLEGLDGADALSGAKGDDMLDGGAGVDIYSGGPGADTFRFVAGEANSDSITDFEGVGTAGGDIIVLAGYGQGATFAMEDGTTWLIRSADAKITERITFQAGVAIDSSDHHFED